MVIARISVALMLLLGVGTARASGCLDPTIPHGESVFHARLLHLSPPYFYFRSMDYPYAILIPPNTLKKELQRLHQDPNAQALERALGRQIPLSRNFDLFGYVLSNYSEFSFIERLVAISLEHRDAGVFDAQTGKQLETVTIKRENSEGALRVSFYDPDGGLLIQLVKCIEN